MKATKHVGICCCFGPSRLAQWPSGSNTQPFHTVDVLGCTTGHTSANRAVQASASFPRPVPVHTLWIVSSRGSIWTRDAGSLSTRLLLRAVYTCRTGSKCFKATLHNLFRRRLFHGKHNIWSSILRNLNIWPKLYRNFKRSLTWVYWLINPTCNSLCVGVSVLPWSDTHWTVIAKQLNPSGQDFSSLPALRTKHRTSRTYSDDAPISAVMLVWFIQIIERIKLVCLPYCVPQRSSSMKMSCRGVVLLVVTDWLTAQNRVLLQKPTARADSQEIPRLLWNSEVHHRGHKNPRPVSIQNQMNNIH
jgi:hypothetical protein